MKIRRLLFSLFSTLIYLNNANATPPYPVYIGAQGGLANTHFGLTTVQAATPVDGSTALSSAAIKNHVVAARGYVGYQWSDYFATEVGYFRPRLTRYTQVNRGIVPNGAISEYAIDLRGKLFLPMAAYTHLSPYLELGAAYLTASSQGGITRNGADDFGYSLHPVLGAGIGYHFTEHFTGDLSWATITKRNSQVPRIDMFFIGFVYHFSVENNNADSPNVGNPVKDDA